MTTRSALLAVAVAGALGLAPAVAHAQTRAECEAALTDAGVAPERFGADPCQSLSVMLAALSPAANRAFRQITDPGAVIAPRDLQARQSQHPALSGSLAQSEAVPDVRPAAAASGAIAALGSDAGADAIAAVSINPAIFLLADHATEALAKYSRFADLTVFLPVSGIDEDDDDDGIDYVGVRLRLNHHGLRAGDRLWTRARELFDTWITDAARRSNGVRALLAQAPDVRACASALRTVDDPQLVRGVCGGVVEFGFSDADIAALRAQLADIRRTVDSRYFGLDLRADFGDPTLGAVEDASGTFLFAGLAAGRQLTGAPGIGGIGVSARLGARHASLDVPGAEGQFQVEGGAGLGLTRPFEMQALTAAAGFEVRYGGESDGIHAPLDTDFALFRASVNVPVFAGNSVSIAVGVPIDGELSSFLSVNFNWGLLLPAGTPPLTGG